MYSLLVCNFQKKNTRRNLDQLFALDLFFPCQWYSVQGTTIPPPPPPGVWQEGWRKVCSPPQCSVEGTQTKTVPVKWDPFLPRYEHIPRVLWSRSCRMLFSLHRFSVLSPEEASHIVGVCLCVWRIWHCTWHSSADDFVIENLKNLVSLSNRSPGHQFVRAQKSPVPLGCLSTGFRFFTSRQRHRWARRQFPQRRRQRFPRRQRLWRKRRQEQERQEVRWERTQQKRQGSKIFLHSW